MRCCEHHLKTFKEKIKFLKLDEDIKQMLEQSSAPINWFWNLFSKGIKKEIKKELRDIDFRKFFN